MATPNVPGHEVNCDFAQKGGPCSCPRRDVIKTRDERYSEIFNYKVGAIKVSDMSNEQLASHIGELESVLQDLIFEKRTEIQAARHTLYDRLENAEETERERVRKIDREYSAKRQKGEEAAIDARKARMSRKEKMIESLVKCGIPRTVAEEQAKNVK